MHATILWVGYFWSTRGMLGSFLEIRANEQMYRDLVFAVIFKV